MDKVAVTIVGGGVFSPRLCEAFARAIDLPEVELRLTARRADRLRILAEHGAARLTPVRPGWAVRAEPSLEKACEGASIVVLLARVGGLEARAWDEAFPRRFGLAGDEGLGPGGIANAWRTVPELGRIAHILRRIAPQARVLNLMAPLGITTRLLLEQRLNAVGLCELPVATLEAWLARAGYSAAGATYRYGGLNHLGWFWEVFSGDKDVLRLLANATASSGPTAPLDRSTLEWYGAAPLRYYYEVFEPEVGQRLGVERRPHRARELADLADILVQRFSATPGAEVPEADARATPWLDRAVAPAAAAFLGGPAHEGFANVQNDDKIPELPAELIVELSATFTSAGARPTKPGPLPERVAGFLSRAAHAEALAFRAAEHRDPALLAAAIRALPLPISEPWVQELAMLIQRGPGG